MSQKDLKDTITFQEKAARHHAFAALHLKFGEVDMWAHHMDISAQYAELARDCMGI